MKKVILPVISITLACIVVLMIASPASTAQSSIQVEKTEINGLIEAHVGDTLQYEYRVFKPVGDANILNVVVTDDAGTPGDMSDDFQPTYISGDDTDGILEDNETWLYRSDPYTITDTTPNPFTNQVTAVGNDATIGLLVEGNSRWTVGIVPQDIGGGEVFPADTVGINNVWAYWIVSVLLVIGCATWFTLRRRMSQQG